MLKTLDKIIGKYVEWRMAVAAKSVAEESGIELRKIEADSSGWRMDIAAPDLLPLLVQACGLLDHADAKNFLEITMVPPQHYVRDRRAVRITLQWLHGLSPADQNKKQREEIAQLKQLVEQQRRTVDIQNDTIAVQCETIAYLREEKDATR